MPKPDNVIDNRRRTVPVAIARRMAHLRHMAEELHALAPSFQNPDTRRDFIHVADTLWLYGGGHAEWTRPVETQNALLFAATILAQLREGDDRGFTSRWKAAVPRLQLGARVCFAKAGAEVELDDSLPANPDKLTARDLVRRMARAAGMTRKQIRTLFTKPGK